MSLSFAFFETKCFSCHFVTAQIAHGPFIVAILAHHNNPQSGGLRFGFFSLLLKVHLLVFVTVVMTS